MAQQQSQSEKPRGNIQHGGPGMGMNIEKPKNLQKAVSRLLEYLLPYKTTLIIVLILVVLFTLAGLLGPYLTGVAIDRYIIPKDLPGLGRISLIMLGAFLAYTVLQAISGWLMAEISQKALKQLRKELFSHLQELSLSFFDKNQAGDLMSRLTNDINAINQAVSQNVTSLVANVLSLFGILIAMFV